MRRHSAIAVRRVERPEHRLATMLAAATVVLSPAALARDARYDAARDDYEIGHFEKAFAAFAGLADQGHCDAARMARKMVRDGRPLYYIEFKVAPERLERWQRLPGCPATALASG